MNNDIHVAFSSTSSENRHERRQRTLKAGKVVLSDWTTIDCTIRDLSPEGAKIILGGATSLPEEFRLATVATGAVVPVRLFWQRGLAAGVGFGPKLPAAIKGAKAAA